MLLCSLLCSETWETMPLLSFTDFDFLLQNFLTELASGRGQLDDIMRMAEELVKSRHSKQREIQARQKKVSNRYEH